MVEKIIAMHMGDHPPLITKSQEEDFREALKKYTLSDLLSLEEALYLDSGTLANIGTGQKEVSPEIYAKANPHLDYSL